MASNRSSYRTIYSVLEGFGAFNLKEPTKLTSDNLDAVAYLSKLDEYYQQSEDKVFQTLIEHCASINLANDVEEEIKRLLEQGTFTFDIADDVSAEEEAALSLRIGYIIKEKVIPRLKREQEI